MNPCVTHGQPTGVLKEDLALHPDRGRDTHTQIHTYTYMYIKSETVRCHFLAQSLKSMP